MFLIKTVFYYVIEVLQLIDLSGLGETNISYQA